jgi:8-amino-7-oxononanoate synthase
VHDEIVSICEKHKADIILDEAHATGVIGKNGEGLAQSLNLEVKIFARVHTFGKAMGCHGAIVLGSEDLRQYLINFVFERAKLIKYCLRSSEPRTIAP